MRIIFVTPFYYPEFQFGGPPEKIHGLARGLAKRDHGVTVLTFDNRSRRSRERQQVDGVTVQYLPWIGRGLRQLPLDSFLMRDEIAHADILQTYGLFTVLIPWAASIAAERGIAVVHEPLGMYPPRAANKLPKRAYNRLVTEQMMRNAAAVIAASHAEALELRDIADPKKIFYRRNGVDVERFAFLPSGQHLRQTWGLATNERVIVYVGRISPIKNLEQLVLAFERAKLTDVRLVLVGPHSEHAYQIALRNLISARGLNERVIIAGPLYEEEQKAALSVADLFVLPSLNESFGNAAAEAVAAGVPILLTETCGVAPLIHRRAGYAVPLGVESIANGIRRMLDPMFRDEMTSRREEVKRELSWDEPVERTIELYERIIRNAKGAARNEAGQFG